MIILSCKYCGCLELDPLKNFYEASCTQCGRSLYLWQMKPILVSRPESELKDTNLSKIQVK